MELLEGLIFLESVKLFEEGLQSWLIIVDEGEF
jgi:hypothetical protein